MTKASKKEQLSKVLEEYHFVNVNGLWYSSCLDYAYDSNNQEFLEHCEVEGNLSYLTSIGGAEDMVVLLDALDIAQ